MKILVIDDDIPLSESIKTALESESATVDCTHDGDSGSYIARTNSYDIIILDNILPKKSGLRVCEEIRAAEKNTPILILSIKDSADTKTLFLNAGADDYLNKPFSLSELHARIKAILRRPANLKPNILKIEDLSLDTGRQQVSRGKRIIYLTRKEFSLLEYLLEHKGMVVSRGMIMEHVWNMDTDPFSNTIEAHILNLRKKIEVRGRRKLIHNVPGRGYKIDVE